MKLYIETTRDKYRLIVDFDTNPAALAKRAGVTANHVWSTCSMAKHKHKELRFQVVEVEDDDD